MHTDKTKNLLVSVCLASLVLFLSPPLAKTQEKERGLGFGQARPLSEILNADGTLKLEPNVRGNFDPRGYRMISEPGGPPTFVRESSPSLADAGVLYASGDGVWDNRFYLRGTNGTIHAIAEIDGIAYVGGEFSTIGNIFANNIASWNGTTWSALEAGVDGPVYSLGGDGPGLWVGGNFHKTGTGLLTLNHVALWHYGEWRALGPGLDAPAYAWAMVGPYSFVGGAFVQTSDASVTLNHFATWNGATWSPVGTGVNGDVRTIYWSGTNAFLGGAFTSTGDGGVTLNRIARWTGSSYLPLGPGLNGPVLDIIPGSGYLYAAGQFTKTGNEGTTLNYIGAWDGKAWYPLNVGMNGTVYALAISGTDLYAGGEFHSAGGIPANHAAKWSGVSWTALGTGMSGYGFECVEDLAVLSQGLLAGGIFGTADGLVANNLSLWNGASWSALFGGQGANSAVYSLLIDGSVCYAGGAFYTAGGAAAYYVAKWDGTSWSKLGSGMNGPVWALAIKGTDLYAGGGFTMAGGAPANYVAKWNGASWSPLGSGVFDDVYALAVVGTDVYSGGAAGIYRWNGASWSGLGPGLDSGVRALAVIGSDLYVGGYFHQTLNGDTPLQHIGRWNGSSWSPVGNGLNSSVYALAAGPNAELYAGGAFTATYDGTTTLNYIAKWQGGWSALGNGLNSVYTMALAVKGRDVYAGGGFTTAGVVAANHVAKWNGTAWSALGSGVDNVVRTLAVSPTELHVGGTFNSAGSYVSNYYAQWNFNLVLTSPNGGEVWEAGSLHPITWFSKPSVGEIKIEYSTDNGLTWTTIIPATPNDGSFDWPVPSACSTQCLVRISEAIDGDPSDISDSVFTIAGFKVAVPNGGEQWIIGSPQTISWNTAGSYPTVRIELSTDNGSLWSTITSGTANTGGFPWTVQGAISSQCLVKVSDSVDGVPSDTSDAVFSILPLPTITVTGPNGGEIWYVGDLRNITWTSSGSVGNVRIEYSTDAGSSWTDVIVSTPNDGVHPWDVPNTPSNLCLVRISEIDGSPSDMSDATFTIKMDSNSPSSYIVLMEGIWSLAGLGGTWVTDAQITDLTGGSVVSVYFNYGGGNRQGPITLWTGPGPNTSIKFSNLLATLEALDPSAFVYYNKVGAVEFLTQDSSHKIQVASRILNGDYSKTLPGFSDVPANSADTTRLMMIQNLTSNASYRLNCVFFNPSLDPVTVEFRLVDGNGSFIGSGFSRTLLGHDYQVINPFAEAGVSYPAYSYDNVYLLIDPTSGTGRVMAYGSSANNVTSDPAAHIAVQRLGNHPNSSSDRQILIEGIWSWAGLGGTWVTEAQITDVTGGSVVSAYFNYGGGNRKGPFTIWGGLAPNSSVKFTNLLATLDAYDLSGFDYFNKVGTVEFVTQDSSHRILVAARILNGDYSKTLPGLNDVPANSADTTRRLMIQNLTSDFSYRLNCVFFNPSWDPVTVEFRLIGGNGSQIGSSIYRTLVGRDYQVINPFVEAGVSYPAYSHDNVFLLINPISGTGRVMAYGSSANNITSDPAAHFAVQHQ